jgi:hypothetical protein
MSSGIRQIRSAVLPVLPFSTTVGSSLLFTTAVPARKDGRIQTIDGRDWDEQRDGEDQIKWVGNEGIRVARIVQTLREAHPAHPLLQPIFHATPANAHQATSAQFFHPTTRNAN